jgi:hexosaminidase
MSTHIPPLLPAPARVTQCDGALPLRTDPPVTRRTNPSEASLGAEGYAMDVTPSGITLTAAGPAGMAYAEETLRQLRAGAGDALPCMRIEDGPRFPWRGFMLDESRHFQGGAQVRKILDAMALLKMNVFHWHLTDDQGWRMEIRAHPLLTEVGSRRDGSRRDFRREGHDGVPHAGFYTQAEIRGIVEYAAERHITVVPEIEMPGHALSALAAYPRLGCTGGPYRVATGPGINGDVLCVGRESTHAFIQDVLEEVMECFPGELIHIGGDEAPRDRWKACPDCRRLARENGRDAGAVQVLFTNRVASFLRARGRRAVGWDEILAPGLEPGAVVQWWRPGAARLRDALRSGHDVILSPFFDLYLDHSYSLTPLRKAHRFTAGTRRERQEGYGRILGIEAPLWSEFVWSPRRLDYQVFPRLCAYAETGWSGGGVGDYKDFERRVEAFLPSLTGRGITPAPRGEWNPSIIKRAFGLLTIFRGQTGGE